VVTLPAPGSRGWNVALKGAAAQVTLKKGGKAGVSALGGALRRARGKRDE